MAGTAVAKVSFIAYDNSWTNWLSIDNITVTGVAAGPYTWYVVAQDVAGNRTTSSTWQVRYDLPPVPFDLVSPANGTWTANLQPTFSWNATTDAGSGLAKYQLWIDGSLAVDNISASATSFAPTSSTLADGNHTWWVDAVDAAGAVRQSRQKLTVGIDATPPNAFSLLSPVDRDVSTIPTPNLCWNVATDDGSGGDHYQLFLDGALARDNVSATCTTPAAALAEGAHTWTVKAVDKVGNAPASTETWTVYVDFNPPAGFSLVAYSGVTWARIPEGPGQGFRNDSGAYSGGTWALIPV